MGKRWMRDEWRERGGGIVRKEGRGAEKEEMEE